MTVRPAIALLAALVLTACSSGTDRPASTPTPSATTPTATPGEPPTRAPEPPPAPPADSCYRLSYDQAVAPTARAEPVPCRDDHTAETFHVGRLERVLDGRLLAVDSRRLQQQVASTCPRLLPEHVGGTEEQRRLSMLRSVWFTPTLQQSDAGADWFRCDAVALAGESELLRLNGSLSGVLDSEAGRDRVGMCGTAEPGTEGFERVACSRSHSWRALRSVTLPGPDYPGEDAAQRAGEEPCKAAARAAAPDPLDFRWGYEWPTSGQWNAGQTYGICWAPAS
jgi:hypothetical protein